jgi:hypothetical protein
MLMVADGGCVSGKDRKAWKDTQGGCGGPAIAAILGRGFLSLSVGCLSWDWSLMGGFAMGLDVSRLITVVVVFIMETHSGRDRVMRV